MIVYVLDMGSGRALIGCADNMKEANKLVKTMKAELSFGDEDKEFYVEKRKIIPNSILWDLL